MRDYAPETLMLCGEADPLLATNRHALDLIRHHTGREARLVTYPGAVHGFAGVPPQWTFGRWVKDALPATQELVLFHTGKSIAPPPTPIPRDLSPPVVFGGLVLAAVGFMRLMVSATSVAMAWVSSS